MAAANTCIADGQACIRHRFETFLEGDTTMAECAFAVEQDAARLLGQAARAVA